MANFAMSWVVLDHLMSYNDISYDDFSSNYTLSEDEDISKIMAPNSYKLNEIS
jgi:hypothetical protein